MQKVIAKIHLTNIRRNAELFAAATGKPLRAVVKANAYGHGAEEVVNALSGVASSFAVALIEEGIAVRGAACGKDILVFTPPTELEEVYQLAVNRFTASVDSLRTARLVAAFCGKYRLPVRVHLKVNTGMNRYGMNESALGKVCKLFQSEPLVQVAGIYSHLYAHTLDIAERQRRLFVHAICICKRYFPNVTAHLGATYGALLGKKFTFDGVRIGLGLYGYAYDKSLPLQRGMTVYAKAVSNRAYAFGGIGYGESDLERGTPLSVLRAGYADGIPRGKGVCMDAFITQNKRRLGELVPIMTDAEATARAIGSIPYEVLCAATRRAEFIYD